MTERQSPRRNYGVLLGQGVSLNAADELTSVKLVLPFLYTSVGAPVFFAGLLVPVYTLTKIGVQMVVAPIVSAARTTKKFMILAALATALALALISLTVNAVGAAWLVPIFLFVALAIGAAKGLGSLAFQDLIGRVLPGDRRSHLLFTQSSLAGIFTVIVALGSEFILQPGTSTAAHQELIWLGIGLFVVSALVVAAVREPAEPQPSGKLGAKEDRKRHFEEFWGSFRIAFALPWFHRFLIARTLFLSIELAMPFYSIHAATFHGNSVSGLNAFVIASSIGLVAGGPLWPRIGKSSVYAILVMAAGTACLGGLLAIAIELRLVSQGILFYAIVFVLISLGTQGIRNGRTLFLIGVTTHEERPYCIAVANVTIGIVAVAFGAILGALASFQGVAWPIFVLIALNVVAAIYALKLRNIRR